MSQHLDLMSWFLLREFREVYRNKMMLLGYLSTTVVTLSIYWFTSKAFAPSIQSGLQSGDQSYFSYILLGDLTFLIPSLMFVGIADVIRRNAVDKTLEPMLVSTYEPKQLMLLQIIAILPIEMLKAMITFIFAILLFEFELPMISLIKIILLQALSLPLFLGLGLIGGAILLRFFRGEGILSQLSSLGMILAGAYFPISVLPKGLKVFGEYLSPFNLLLNGVRNSVYPNEDFVFVQIASLILIWGVLTFILGYFLLGRSIEFNRHQGQPFLFMR